MPGSLTLVTEEILTEQVAQKLLAYVDPEASFGLCIGRQGIGYIRQRLSKLNQAARGMRIVVIADRDRPSNCPINMIRQWLGSERHPNLLIRLAEMEIEAWIMADGEQLSQFLGVSYARIPRSFDDIPDPKRELVRLAGFSRRRTVREGMCPASRSSAVVGPEYNSELERFVITNWRPEVASQSSPSLARAIEKIRALAIC